MVRNRDRVTKEGMIGAWVGFIVVTIVMITLAFALFKEWLFWMWFAEMGVLIGGVVTTIYYFGRDSKKCYTCGNTMDWNVEFCKKCGTKIPSHCENCGADINANTQYCEKCGKSAVIGVITQPNIKNEPKITQASYNSKSSNKFCPACGSKIELNANHCPSCGIKL
jgi:predicted amidophosphoribosyltransferase